MGTSKARTPAKYTELKLQPLPKKTIIIDNGAYTIKAGYVPTSSPPLKNEDEWLSACSIIPNALAKTRANRVFIGNHLSTHISDWNEVSFRRPVEKGYIVNWEAQKEIWEHSFFDEKTSRYNKDLRITDPEETTLLLTEAPNALPSLQKNADEIIMEEWGFGGYLRYVGEWSMAIFDLSTNDLRFSPSPYVFPLFAFPACVAIHLLTCYVTMYLGPALNAWNDIHTIFGDQSAQTSDSTATPVECLLVVDSGYSHTTITPVYMGRPLQRAIRRLELGGKHLTNYIKEIVSMRQYNMVDETYIINDVKEAVCYVSSDFTNDMERTWKGNRGRGSTADIVVEYVLPDPASNKKGFVRPHDPLLGAKKKKSLLSGSGTETASDDFLVLGNERFTVPEILFSPGDIGMKQAGIPEAILQSLSVLPTGLHPVFLANILVVGGNALLPGFVERLYVLTLS
jgi:actin-related protein 6